MFEWLVQVSIVTLSLPTIRPIFSSVPENIVSVVPIGVHWLLSEPCKSISLNNLIVFPE